MLNGRTFSSNASVCVADMVVRSLIISVRSQFSRGLLPVVIKTLRRETI